MDSIESDKGSSLWKDAWIKLSKNRLALVGLGLLVILIVTSLLTPLIAPYGYEAQDLDMGATAPSLQHWLGTDIFGRDMLTRIMYGGRVSLMVGFIATAVALVIGILWGASAGFFGGRLRGRATSTSSTSRAAAVRTCTTKSKLGWSAGRAWPRAFASVVVFGRGIVQRRFSARGSRLAARGSRLAVDGGRAARS